MRFETPRSKVIRRQIDTSVYCSRHWWLVLPVPLVSKSGEFHSGGPFSGSGRRHKRVLPPLGLTHHILPLPLVVNENLWSMSSTPKRLIRRRKYKGVLLSDYLEVMLYKSKEILYTDLHLTDSVTIYLQIERLLDGLIRGSSMS